MSAAPHLVSAEAATQHLTTVLHLLAGPQATPRGDQVAAVQAIVQPAARVLVVQATGWGKSAVYWAATSALRAAGAGPTLVISPLLALMRDQVSAAERAGLRAATVNSTNLDEWNPVFAALDRDELDVLLVSPERLGNPRFAARLDELMRRVGLVVIDEAHCISDWGFDFRPDYQRLARALLNTPSASVLATTATANQRVTTDVERQLGDSTVTFRGTLARTSLRLSVVPELSAIERYAWVADALATIEGSGIIYVLTVAEAERLAAFLRHCGYSTPAYTGQMEADDRVRIEDLLRRNEVKAVVATSALGMGYDKPDLGFCIHVGSPSTPVAYYQQVGRAGRAVAHAEAVLLPAANDEQIWEYFATASIPDPEMAEKALAALSAGPLGLLDIESATGARRGRLEALLKILAVDGVVAKDGTRWEATGAPYTHDHDKWRALAASRRAEADIMRHYAHGEGCLMAYLQTALDDPNPAPCGKCSVCTGALPGPGAVPGAQHLTAAREFLRGADLVIDPRKRWPGGVSRKGAIAGIAEGRAVAFADDPGWSAEVAALQRSAWSSIPAEMLDGAVAALGRWRSTWPARPVAVVPAPAFGAEMQANRLLAQHLSAVGKLPLVDCFTMQGGAAPADSSSTPVVAHLEGALVLDPAADVPRGPVLLCATSMRTGWTLTVAAALLYDVFGTTSMPLVLHRRP
ncbi:MAG: RecQ family ATP-dependent DNA helicase [Actinobacteria bacterium]|uniref:DNA 3'-5' helicase n=1 Tax=freshwater metagenome TaxID=449393 RepID=A0A6J7CDG3_9ZZZZ|nr:RecQ family ATP-dependent DNA helicase [Actinomycetota bacterium]MSW79261.1 RecQ family ATP-dependent DNA helicase [Actinomycetota bacterium]MSX56832.1 RecQ family ATP-dependent DNA helicase [Actinomycetota bacterium]MSZ83395.1 RecQ family ATP-dependent DNA helicase [Actinomycetota bacterium]MTB19735.1 RecQ family ATP-dependent DNA helicase [Actinomycetota bacterium]